MIGVSEYSMKFNYRALLNRRQILICSFMKIISRMLEIKTLKEWEEWRRAGLVNVFVVECYRILYLQQHPIVSKYHASMMLRESKAKQHFWTDIASISLKIYLKKQINMMISQDHFWDINWFHFLLFWNSKLFWTTCFPFTTPLYMKHFLVEGLFHLRPKRKKSKYQSWVSVIKRNSLGKQGWKDK